LKCDYRIGERTKYKSGNTNTNSNTNRIRNIRRTPQKTSPPAMATQRNKNGKRRNETKPFQTKPKPKASVKLRFMCQSNFYDYMGKRKQFIHFGVFLQMGYTRYGGGFDNNKNMIYI